MSSSYKSKIRKQRNAMQLALARMDGELPRGMDGQTLTQREQDMNELLRQRQKELSNLTDLPIEVSTDLGNVVNDDENYSSTRSRGSRSERSIANAEEQVQRTLRDLRPTGSH
jgi:hypothetical protein